MSNNLHALILKSQEPSPWDLGNEVLYQLCASHPLHTYLPAVVAKVWLIGRSYAAALERRKSTETAEANDDFYLKTAAPAIMKSDIDSWIVSARQHSAIGLSSLTASLEAHRRTTDLFKSISKQDKRSLASKYLHFHVPSMFYIYDSRAVEAMRELSKTVGRVGKKTVAVDNEYRKFAQKCVRLQQYVQDQFSVSLTPRQLDKLLLEIHAAKLNLLLHPTLASGPRSSR
jgi:hypothetical protein